MYGEARMMTQVKIVRTRDQRLVGVDLHRGGGRQLVATGGRLQPSAVRSLVDHVSARGRRVGGAIDGQRRDIVMQRAILMINTVRIGRRRLDGRDGRYALIATGR